MHLFRRLDRTAVLAALALLLTLTGIGLRWRHLGARIDHFDEVFPVALIARARETGNLDMNPRDADVPAISKYNQYAGSSYHYAVLAWDTVMRVFPGWPDDHPVKPSILRLRAFSALLSSAALVLFALAAWRKLGPGGGLTAIALTALNPTLIQDAHYARPDAMLTFLVVLYAVLLSRPGVPSLRRCLAVGVVLGALVAAKNTMGLLAVLPCVWWLREARPRGTESLQRRAEFTPQPKAGGPLGRWKALGITGATALGTFLATEPGVWLHFGDFLDGVRRLQVQYSNPFPIHGHPSGGAVYDLVVPYFLATLGIVTLALGAAGAVLWARARQWRKVIVWIAPLVVFGAYFGAKTIFFERAFSAFLPGLFLAAGYAVARWADRRQSVLLVPCVLTALAVLPGALITDRFVTHVLSGNAAKRVAHYDAALAKAVPETEVVSTPMWAPPHLDALREKAHAQNGKPFIARVSDPGDEWTARQYTDFLRSLPAREFAVVRGPFEQLPISTLQVYHVPTWRYVWVGQTPPPTALPHPLPPALGLLGWTAQRLLQPVWRYQTLAVMAFLLPLALAFHALQRESRSQALATTADGSSTYAEHTWLFPLSLVVALFACRWPGFLHLPELNVDEAHTIAGGITLQHDPVYWHSVDGTTHGPLNDFVLLLPRLFGWAIDFATARVVGCALVAVTVIALWAGMRRLWGEAAARLGVLPLLTFFALSTFWDFVHYTSEHLSLAMLSLGWMCAVSARARTLEPVGRRRDGASAHETGFPSADESAREFRLKAGLRAKTSGGSAAARRSAMEVVRDAAGGSWRWLAAGLAFGAVPYAKMQGAPIAAVLTMLTLAWAWSARRTHGWRPLASFVLGLLIPTIGCLVHLWVFDLWHHFWQAYVLNNVRYATQTKEHTVWQMIRAMPTWTEPAEGFGAYAAGLLACTLAGLMFVGRTSAARLRHYAAALVLAAAALYATVAPGRQFFHYLLFFVVPLGGLAAAALAIALQERQKATRWVVAVLFLLVAVGPQLRAKFAHDNPYVKETAYFEGQRSTLVDAVLRHSRAGEPMGIWGYMPRYWVETQLPQAAREGHNERQIIPSPQFQYYRNRYLSDLRRNRPPVFLDSVGPNSFWLTNRAQNGHESWPELKQWVDENYVLDADVDGVRVYVRKDRQAK